MDTDLPEIARISEPKWRAHSSVSVCQEAPNDFGSLTVQEFLHYGNMELRDSMRIVYDVTLEGE
jgi:hypothetical protein